MEAMDMDSWSSSVTPEGIFYAVLAFSWAEYAWEAYLSHRQRRIYHSQTKVPKELDGIVDQSTFDKARLYALDRSNFGAVEGLFSQVLSTLIMWFYGFKVVWDLAGDANESCGMDRDNEVARSCWFVLVFNLFSTVVGLPFSIYSTFVVEQRHGFNQQTASFYAKDQVKKFLVSQAVMLPLVAAVVKIIHWGGDSFVIYLWSFVTAFTMFMMVVYPEFIAPLFDKYTPLPEGNLRKEIESLAASIEFPLYKLFVVEGSKRSSHSNAYFYGFFNFKRIVLFDTLLEASEREKLKSAIEVDQDKGTVVVDDDKDADKDDEAKERLKKQGCNTGEILAVLGHELGHWKLNHVLKNIVISEVHILLMFAFFGYLYKNQMLYAAFGFPDEMPVLIGERRSIRNFHQKTSRITGFELQI